MVDSEEKQGKTRKTFPPPTSNQVTNFRGFVPHAPAYVGAGKANGQYYIDCALHELDGLVRSRICVGCAALTCLPC